MCAFCALVLGSLTACQPATQSDVRELKGEVAALAQKIDALTQRLGGARPAAQPSGPPEDFEKVHSIDVGSAPILGNKDAPVTLVEYSDFQCPFCARADPFIKELQGKYPNKLRVVFKHFPLTEIHPAARPVAIASLAAQAQGKFWEFHDVLFKNYRTLDGSPESIERYAQEAGLNVAKFKKDLEANRAKYESQVDQDVKQGMQVDVRGTPTLYLNGKKVDPRLRSIDAMSSVIDSLLEKKS
jgi:protein-disulfide isomerase